MTEKKSKQMVGGYSTRWQHVQQRNYYEHY